ncbi:helix-turn-helix transcriptional regulator [Kushneria aurantia]|uniref:Helix-turn-helix transcriptional regulator n=1 Tax=Kushneria aurantia TaxID=504092 RepID=A0ABV6G118_9GAMM|nr:WYL domain-containing protein [Kushneria aurantia]
MSQNRDTLLRLFALLRLIPTYPGYIATTTLLEKLRERGFAIDMRTVQRDLNRLSVPFSLLCDESITPYRWSLTQGAPLELRDMDPATALALHLAEGHLASVLPQSVFDLLAPQFRRARGYLDCSARNELADWARRVRTLPNGKALQPAPIDSEVWQQVSTALLEHKRLRVNYLSRSKEEVKTLELHPLGFITRHAISYVIASVEGYDDRRQFALHRIQQAECLDSSANNDACFDIDHFLSSNFNAPGSLKEVELVADISPDIAWILRETPLGHEQQIETLPDSDWHRLRAKVRDDQETLWWVFGLNSHIRVYEPARWTVTILDNLNQAMKFYENEANYGKR